MEFPTQIHFQAAKRILHYIKETLGYDMFYTYSGDFSLVRYTDYNWAVDVDNRKSTSGSVYL